MRRFALSLTLLLIVSCKESFKTIDTSSFNKQIERRTDIETPEELITIFYANTDRIPELEITTIREDEVYTITLIHNNVPDDSVRDEKIIMQAKKSSDGTWYVTEILSNWRCRNYRGGNTGWGSEICP